MQIQPSCHTQAFLDFQVSNESYSLTYCQVHGPHVGWEERLTKIRCWSGVLQANSTILSYTGISGLSDFQVTSESYSHKYSQDHGSHVGREEQLMKLGRWSEVLHADLTTMSYTGISGLSGDN